MDSYFELYGLTPTFTPDKATVKARFYELSRQYHPDRYTQSSPAEQLKALSIAARNNEAYKTLMDPDATMAHVLRLHGLLEDEEKYALPPDFLMEMMDLNEAISDWEDGGTDDAREQAQAALQQAFSDWTATIAPLLAAYQPETPDAALLLQIKDGYFRKKYLLRIQERITKFAAR